MSKRGCTHGNAVAKANFKVIKTEFINNYFFKNLKELEYKLFEYLNWYNNFRLHGSLDYFLPVEYKEDYVLEKVVLI